jgi:ADP-ribose pyrophosphatase YjhB (NUDIX family)
MALGRDCCDAARSEDVRVQDISTTTTWLPEEDLSWVRERVPLICVDAVPVRLDHLGQVERIGLLLRALPDGTVSRAIVTGRILRGETVREALWRHLTKDLGPDCDPQLPASITPYTVVEYFPDPHRTGFHDPRQHTVSLAYVVPMNGDCRPAADALDFAWLTVDEVTSRAVVSEMSQGHDRVVRLALASCRRLP